MTSEIVVAKMGGTIEFNTVYAWSLQMRATVDDMLGMPFYHPVVEEGLRTALRDAVAQLQAGA